MKGFSFIHAGDLHLDSPFKGVSEISQEIGSKLKEATFETFDGLIELCIEKEVDFLLISGDVYDGTDRSLKAQLRFKKGLEKLSQAQVKAFVVHGNHDPLNGWSASLNWPENVHIFGKELEEITFEKDGEEVAKICGISFPKKDIRANLAKKFPNKNNDLIHIGLLHCNVGSDTGHEPYASCTLQDLVDKNYDYWALGHVHNRNVLNEEPLVVYPGNTQGLNPREVGHRGCYYVAVNNNKISYDFIEIDSLQWHIEELPINDLSSEEELISVMRDLIENVREKADGKPSICRISLTGRGELHPVISRIGFLEDVLQEVREGEEGERDFVWIESLGDNTSSSIDRNELLGRDDFTSVLVKLFDEAYSDNELREELTGVIEPVFASPSGRKILNQPDDEQLIELIKKAETLCIDMLLE